MPDAMPARCTGTEPVNECEAGVPGESDACPDEGIADAHDPVRDALVPEEQHHDEANEAEAVPDEQREPGTPLIDELRRSRGDKDHEQGCRQDGRSRLEGRVAEDVLEELLTDEHGAHERPKDDDSGERGDPEDPPRSDGEVVEGICNPALSNEERYEGGNGDRCQP